MLGNSEAIEAALATEGEVAAELPAEAAAMGDEAVLEPPPEVGELPPDEAMPAEVPTVDDLRTAACRHRTCPHVHAHVYAHVAAMLYVCC